MKKDYQKALEIVNGILEQDPEYHYALFVKAQILHQGFNNIDGAKKYLKAIIDDKEADKTIFNWASSLYEQLDPDTSYMYETDKNENTHN